MSVPPYQSFYSHVISSMGLPRSGSRSGGYWRPAWARRPPSFPVALPATTRHEAQCSTHGVDSEDVVIARRRKVENDLARLAERHAGTCVDVEAAARRPGRWRRPCRGSRPARR